MSAIRSKNTAPEILLRQHLHRDGFRFRLHTRSLPGSPDLVLAQYRAAVFVNGCFWHVHECAKFRWPRTRADFWREKLLANKTRDAANLFDLGASGWRVAVVWECALSPTDRAAETSVLLGEWLRSGGGLIDLAGPPG
jgi:DNA mismatch endonuclease (patch repair protein)